MPAEKLNNRSPLQPLMGSSAFSPFMLVSFLISLVYITCNCLKGFTNVLQSSIQLTTAIVMVPLGEVKVKSFTNSSTFLLVDFYPEFTMYMF